MPLKGREALQKQETAEKIVDLRLRQSAKKGLLSGELSIALASRWDS